MCHPVPVPPTACARAQQYRECLAFPVPAGCLPAGAGTGGGGAGMAGSLPRSPHPSRSATHGTRHGAGISDGTGPQTPDSWSGAPAPPNPRIPSSGLGAGSWERAMFSPSAPDDAGGFFGSGSLLRQREQNQSGCLVGLETNKTPWQPLRAGWSGQRGAGMGSQRPEIPGHGVLLSGNGKWAGLAPWLPIAPFPAP